MPRATQGGASNRGVGAGYISGQGVPPERGVGSRSLYGGTEDRLAYLEAQVAYLTSELLTTGQELFPRRFGNTNTGITMSTGLFRITYFTARKTEISSQIRVASGNTAAGATPTVIRFGLYELDSSGNGALIASTANDTTLLSGANTSYSKAWSSPIQLTAGKRYAVGFLVVTAATAPILSGLVAPLADDPSFGPKQSAALSAQADLPSTFTDASLSVTGSSPYAVLLP